MNIVTRNKLIVALDVESAQAARDLVAALRGVVGMFKVGNRLFTAAGPSIVREIVDSGEKVFLDLKFHDIPNTVASAGVGAARLGVSIFNVHASGGSEMMRRVADAVSNAAGAEGFVRPAIVAVTVLTSLDETTLTSVGCRSKPDEQVRRLSLLAEASGMDGVVASAHEIGLVRSAVRRGFLIVVPGVRPSGDDFDDQKRVAVPAEAIRAGADYIVVGRPIIKAKDPVQTARQIIAEMSDVFAAQES